jgi:hypothetical protein
LSTMQQQQSTTTEQPTTRMALDPESEDTHMYPPDDDILIPFQPCSCVRIPRREHSFLHCWDFIVLQEHLAIDADVDGVPVTLHAKIGLIPHITSIGNHQQILLFLLISAFKCPTAIIYEEAAPPDQRQYSIIGPEQATLNYFPFDDCYSRCNWDLLVQVAMLINRELSRLFMAQHTLQSIHLFLSKAEFEYSKWRMMPAVEVYKKGRLSTNTPSTHL